MKEEAEGRKGRREGRRRQEGEVNEKVNKGGGLTGIVNRFVVDYGLTLDIVEMSEKQCCERWEWHVECQKQSEVRPTLLRQCLCISLRYNSSHSQD